SPQKNFKATLLAISIDAALASTASKRVAILPLCTPKFRLRKCSVTPPRSVRFPRAAPVTRWSRRISSRFRRTWSARFLTKRRRNDERPAHSHSFEGIRSSHARPIRRRDRRDREAHGCARGRSHSAAYFDRKVYRQSFAPRRQKIDGPI